MYNQGRVLPSRRERNVNTQSFAERAMADAVKADGALVDRLAECEQLADDLTKLVILWAKFKGDKRVQAAITWAGTGLIKYYGAEQYDVAHALGRHRVLKHAGTGQRGKRGEANGE